MQSTHTAPAATPPLSSSTPLAGWRYIDKGWTRDLRIDFLRGIVFLLLFTTHFNYFSWFALIGWERIGIVSSAEVFILLAGVVTGAVYGKKLKTDGLGKCTIKLFRRAWTLYKIAIIVAGSVALLRLVPGLDVTELTTFTDPVTRQVYPLYPDLAAGFLSNLLHVLVLAAAPHQFQIVGLYVILFLLTPIVFWALSRGYWAGLLLLSWGCYLINYFAPEPQPGTAAIRLTVSQFEYAFPIMAWQLLFIHGILAGYYRPKILQFFGTGVGRILIALSMLASLLLLLLSWNHPLPQLPEWAKLQAIAPDTFNAVYQDYFLKYKLGPGRVLNITVLMISAFTVLTVAWKPIHKALGWLFIPLGQESMYVFFMHIYLILLVANSPIPALNNVWINTAMHAGALLTIWMMVRRKFLFHWIPH